MKRLFPICGLVGICMALIPAPAAAQTQSDILAAVPSDAWAALCVRNASELDAKLIALSQQLNTPPMSALELIKAQLQLTAVNDSGSVAIVVMPNPMIMGNPVQTLAVLVPCADYAAMTGPMNGEDAGEGISKVVFLNQESYVAQYGAYAVFAPTAEAVKMVLAAANGPGMTSRLNEHEKERFAKDDVTLWLNWGDMAVNPAIQPMLLMMFQMQGPSGAEIVNNLRDVVVSVRLEGEGVHLGLFTGMKEGSRQASIWQTMKPTSDSMLTGLPNEEFLLAVGSVFSSEEAKDFATDVAASFSNPMLAMQLQADPQKLSQASALMTEVVGDLRGVAAGISAMPSGSDGMVGFAKVVTVEGGAAEKCGKMAELIKLITSSVAPSPEVRKAMENVKYETGKETIAGVTVDHPSAQIDQIEGITPEHLAGIQKVLGSEGILIRIATVDDKHIAAAFGGGASRMEGIIEQVKQGGAPLAAHAGIKQVAGMLRESRGAEIYAAIDRLINTSADIAVAVGDPEQAPPRFPQVDSPAGVVAGSIGSDGYQVDVALPMGLVKAIKDYALTMQMGAGPDGGAEAGEGAGTSQE